MKGSQALLAGVIGWPIGHSLSPRLHAYWLAENHVWGFYVPLAVRREDFGEVCRSLAKSGFAGVNVTVPHKEAAFALANMTDTSADKAEAANLLLFREDKRIEARNTDSCGLASCLEESLGKTALRGASAVLLGAGGAARAAIFALEALGVGKIMVLNRNRRRADEMAIALQPRVSPRLTVLSRADWPDVATGAQLLVNATSGGMKGAAPLELSLETLSRDAAVCDLVYNPIETPLLKDARFRGHRTIDGLGMLIHQAVPAFEAFFGTRPAISEELRRSLTEALGG